MTDPAVLKSKVEYLGNEGVATWQGRVSNDTDGFKRYMREVVRARVADEESPFDAELRGLTTTDMETKFIESLLSSVPLPKSWEIGEALAECALRDDWSSFVCWPWNTVRDRRNPRASLPGADLVGFYEENNQVSLLVGEVKTSSDTNTPPRVVTGSGGMIWQLEQVCNRLDILRTILEWLRSRCNSQQYLYLYQKAVGRLVKSKGKDLLLVGVLMRDTNPDERDLKSGGARLGTRLMRPTRVELVAWYLPVRIANWSSLMNPVTS